MSTLKVTHLQNENGTGPAMSIAVGGGVTFAGITTFHDAIEVETGTSISSPSSNVLTLRTAGSERLRITSGGSLQVKGDVNPNAVFDRGSANTTNVNFNYNGTLTGQLGAANQEFQISVVGSSTPLVAYVNGTERLRITSDGKVNVNQSNGTIGSKFNIFNGSDTPNILGVTGADESSEYAAIGVDGGNAIITGGGSGSTSTGIVFRTSASGTEAERLRITSTGISQFTAPQRVATFTGNGIEVNHSAGSNVFIGTQSGTEGKIGTINSAPMSIYAGNSYTNRAELSTNGDFTLHNGNLVLASGHGIDFSATSNSSGTMTSELLDDYEEGSWTPRITGSGGATGQSYAIQTGYYTKIGNVATYHFDVALSALGTLLGGYVVISNLPFSGGYGGNTGGHALITYATNVTFGSGDGRNIILAYMNNSTCYLMSPSNTSAGGVALSDYILPSDGHIGPNSRLIGSITHHGV